MMPDRDSHETHPARNAKVNNRALRGPHREGLPAAEIGTGQGTDGQWYARWGWQVPNTGSWAPITHSPPFNTEPEAIEWATGKILAAMDKPRPNATGSDEKWARRIVEWSRAQLAPQQGELTL